MTEGEFQEFMITVGYRYNEKLKFAFNSFEGFKTVIKFLEKKNRYSLTVKTGTSATAELKKRLKAYETEHKNYVTRARYSDRFIKINLKMTIDSDIDKEELKQLVHFMTELFKSEILEPLCEVCSRPRKTGLYIVGSEPAAICDKCLARKKRQYEIRKNKFIMKKQNMKLGLIGAVFGAIFGACVYILLYQFIPTFGAGGIIVIVPSFAGFVVTGKRATVKSALICAAISAVIFLTAEYLSMVASMAILIERNGGGIAVSEAIDVINSSFGDLSYIMPVIIDTSMGLGFMIIVGIIYFLKRAFTRPLKISNNIL